MRKISTILFYLSALIGMILSIIGMSIAKDYYKDVLYNANLISIVVGLVLRPILMHYDKPIPAGIITLIFVSSGIIGIASAILLFLYPNEYDFKKHKFTTPPERIIPGVKPLTLEEVEEYATKVNSLMDKYKRGSIIKDTLINELDIIKNEVEDKKMNVISMMNKVENITYDTCDSIKKELKQNFLDLSKVVDQINTLYA